MAVMMREAWTDERLDDLNERIAGIDQRMEAGFAELRTEIRDLRAEMRAGFKEVQAEMQGGFENARAEMQSGFEKARAEMQGGFKEAQAESVSIRQDMANQFAAQNRMMIQLAGGMFATMTIGFLGTIATIITQT